MYIIGILIYFLMALSLYFVSAIRELYNQAIVLAPEITVAVFCACLYPLAIFIFHRIRNIRDRNKYLYLVSQAKLSASVSVSLGLIGTFQGLTAMVSTIAISMRSGDGELIERMNIMVTAISSALSSMSYAFITSIFGVGSSVVILVSLNYFASWYAKEKDKKSSVNKELDVLLDRMEKIERINLTLLDKILSGHDANEKNMVVFGNILDEMKAYGEKQGLHSQNVQTSLIKLTEQLQLLAQYASDHQDNTIKLQQELQCISHTMMTCLGNSEKSCHELSLLSQCVISIQDNIVKLHHESQVMSQYLCDNCQNHSRLYHELQGISQLTSHQLETSEKSQQELQQLAQLLDKINDNQQAVIGKFNEMGLSVKQMLDIENASFLKLEEMNTDKKIFQNKISKIAEVLYHE